MSGKLGPLEWRQHQTDDFEAAQTHADARQAQIHTSMPGKIVSFDPKTMTAVVQPALQSMQKQNDGSAKPVDIHPIADVPVHFPGGGGHAMTFPVKVGDECMIQFAERSIDNWHQHGGTQQPSDYRMHDINDADGGSGKVTITTSGEVTIDCAKLTVTGNIECKGEVTAKFGGAFVTLSQHKHPAVNTPPTPGTLMEDEDAV
jgi:hypothetical protein